MYISYEEYASMGGTADEEQFNMREPLAEIYMDDWTLNRLHDEEVAPSGNVPQSVKWAMRYLVDYVQSISEGFATSVQGKELSSFSNGVTSLGFVSAEQGQGVQAYDAAKAHIMRMLPIELCSACVSYNYAQ